MYVCFWPTLCKRNRIATFQLDSYRMVPPPFCKRSRTDTLQVQPGYQQAARCYQAATCTNLNKPQGTVRLPPAPFKLNPTYCQAASCNICRVGQNHVYTVYIRYFWQGNHRIYGHIRGICTVLANP
jgi:hypothetical protein